MKAITRICILSTFALVIGAAFHATSASACPPGGYRSFSYAPVHSYGYGYGYGNFARTNFVKPAIAPAIQPGLVPTPGINPAPALAPPAAINPGPAINPALGLNPAPAINPAPALNPAPAFNPAPIAPSGPIGGGPIGGGPIGGGPIGGGDLNPNSTSLQAPSPVAANDPPVNANQSLPRIAAP